MTTALEQGTGTVTIGVEPFTGFTDAKPVYGSSTDIAAQVAREDRIIENEHGENIRTTLTVWVDSGESPLPDHQDRLTHDGGTYIVEYRDQVPNFDGTLDHVEAMCRKVG